MDEQAKLQDEWARAQKWGKQLARKKALATVVSTAVFGLILLAGLMLGLRGLILALFLGVPAGMAVRHAMWPKGQFS